MPPIPGSLLNALGRGVASTRRVMSQVKSVLPGVYETARHRAAVNIARARNRIQTVQEAARAARQTPQFSMKVVPAKPAVRVSAAPAQAARTAPPKVQPQYSTEFTRNSPRVVLRKVEPKTPFFTFRGGARPSIALMGAGAGLGGYTGYQQGDDRNRIGTALLGASLGGLGALGAYHGLPWFFK